MNNIAHPAEQHPDGTDESYKDCIICGAPQAALQRVYDGVYQRTCLDKWACDRRVEDAARREQVRQ